LLVIMKEIPQNRIRATEITETGVLDHISFFCLF